MNTQLQKQILIGGLAGLLITVLAWVFLGGKRDERAALKASIVILEKEVDKGYQLKANYEKLKIEVDQQQKLIEALIKLMPTDGPARRKRQYRRWSRRGRAARSRRRSRRIPAHARRRAGHRDESPACRRGALFP